MRFWIYSKDLFVESKVQTVKCV